METAQAMGWGLVLAMGWATEQEWALVLAWVLWGSALGLGRVWEPVTGWGWY